MLAAAAYNISAEAERGTGYYYCCFLCVHSIAVAAVEKGYAFLCFVEVLLLLIIFLVGCAAAAGGACAAYNISTEAEREVPATVSSFYVSVVYTAMLRTSFADVVLGCFYFCPLDCDIPVIVVDCAAVETGCMLEKYKMVAHLQSCSATTKGDIYVPDTYTKVSLAFSV